MNDDDAMEKLRAFCLENMIRIEVFASLGEGAMEIRYVPNSDRAKVVIESEQS